MSNFEELLKRSELGKKSSHTDTASTKILFPIPRSLTRETIGLASSKLPFYGFDRWHHYEVSWLNEKGKPEVGIAVITSDCTTPCLIESKSMKLYFHTFNTMQLLNVQVLQEIVAHDLTEQMQAPVVVKIFPLLEEKNTVLQSGFSGTCLDALDVACQKYTVHPDFLTTQNTHVEETVYSNLLRSNCPITGQPDWAGVQIHYRGRKINSTGLLKYIVSFQQHSGFHEQCIEKIFVDITAHCQPEKLAVYGRYTRRGGIDITVYRSSEPVNADDIADERLLRE